MSFAKLDSKITSSSLWDQPDHVVRVWVAFLAEKDENGFVRGTVGSMRRTCNVTDDADGKKYSEALACLEGPDPESRSKECDGRRIQRVDGGWIVINHEQYKLHDTIIKEQTRDRVRRYREKNKQNVTDGNATYALPSVSVSVSKSVSVSQSVLKTRQKIGAGDIAFKIGEKQIPYSFYMMVLKQCNDDREMAGRVFFRAKCRSTGNPIGWIQAGLMKNADGERYAFKSIREEDENPSSVREWIDAVVNKYEDANG